MPPGVAVARQRSLQSFASPHRMHPTEVCLVHEARNAARLASSEDRRMWRLLLARLHPDAGGDHDLFAFACAVRDKVHGGEHLAGNAAGTENETGTAAEAASFLGTWHDAMGRWSTSNRDALGKL